MHVSKRVFVFFCFLIVVPGVEGGIWEVILMKDWDERMGRTIDDIAHPLGIFDHSLAANACVMLSSVSPLCPWLNLQVGNLNPYRSRPFLVGAERRRHPPRSVPPYMPQRSPQVQNYPLAS